MAVFCDALTNVSDELTASVVRVINLLLGPKASLKFVQIGVI